MGSSARRGAWVWAAWAAATWLLLPVVLALVLLHPRLRRAARERLGFPGAVVEPGAIWVHAASLGEGRAAAALIRGLRSAAPEAEILRTYTSDTAATQLTGADATLALPVDVSPCVSVWLDRVRPRVLILVEAELWPCLLRACAARGIPVVVVQARVAAGLERLRRWPVAWEGLVGGVRYLAADEATAALVGGVVTGDLKRAAEVGEAAVRWEGDALLAGSTQPGEEAAVLAAWEGVARRPLLVIAPRQPRRFDEVAAWLATTGHRWARRSAVGAVVPPGTEVLLLDTVGELAGLYRHAKVAFVGGTFRADVGGHSPAEALAGGCVVVRGPEVGANPAAWAGVAAEVAGDAAGLLAAFEAAYARVIAGSGPGEAGEARGTGGGGPGGDAVTRTVAALADTLAAPIPAERPLRPWLAPASLVWAAGVALRPAKDERLPVPVISVGALTAGGSGKTPVTAWLAERVARPAVISRGYGRPPGDDVRLGGPGVTAGDTEAAGLGDELTMLTRRGLVVASCPDRARAAHALLAAGWRGTALLDDALQYRHVARDLEVVVIDARWPTGAGLIPVGTRRLPLAWLRRADVVWVNHGPLPEVLAPHVRDDATVVEAHFRPSGWLHAGEVLSLDALSPGPALVAAGIARPAAFVATLRRLGWRSLEVAPFADHHAFSPAERASLVARAAGRPLLVTEKDAARLPRELDAWALRVEVEVRAGEAALLDRLQGLRGPS